MRYLRSKEVKTTSIVAFFLLAPYLHAASVYSFQTVDNSGDPAFNQLLGINNSSTIAGYFGDGNIQPNKGYTVTPPYSQANFVNENFPNSVQTQVVGINSAASLTTVGFYIDGNGNNFGFVDQNGIFTSVADPNTPAGGATVNQLLGVNNNGLAAGFYVDGNGNAHGYTYNISTKLFTPIFDTNGVATTATDVNNEGAISGFFTDANDVTHGFLDINGNFMTLDDPNGTNTMLLGLNNVGQVVGSFVDGNGETQGLIYNIYSQQWLTVSDPNASANAAFNVTGTTINGINDNGSIVGFYSDGTNVNGFVGTTPEPASLSFLAIGGAGVLIARIKKRGNK